MEHEFTPLLREVAGPLPPLDEATLKRIGRRSGWKLQVLMSVLVVAVGLLLVATLADRTETVDFLEPQALGGSASAAPPSVGGQIVASTEITQDVRAQGRWRVLDVVRPVVAGPSQISRTQAELDEVWAAFEADGEAPTLQTGQAALLVSVAGDCTDPSAVRGVEHIRALRPAGTFFAIHVDPTCAIIDRFGSAEPGPRSLLVVSLPDEDVKTAVGVEGVTAAVTSLDWDSLAVETDPTGRFFGVGREDFAGMEWIWGTWNITGNAPMVPVGRRGWVVPVPGECQEFVNLVGVEAMGYVYPDSHGTIMLTMQFDASCAALASGPSSDPQAVYAISLGVEVSNALHGPRGLIVCPPDAHAPACAAGNTEATQTLEGDRLIAIAAWE